MGAMFHLVRTTWLDLILLTEILLVHCRDAGFFVLCQTKQLMLVQFRRQSTVCRSTTKTTLEPSD